MSFRQEDIQSTRSHAELYRARGYAVLPSSMTEKRPLVRFANYWDVMPPTDLLIQFPTTNIQLITGRRWRLLVIDLDGPEAQKIWPTLGWCPRTWISHSGGKGKHVWFTISADYPNEMKFARLWQGADKHSAIERLCDHSLVVVPPSIHVVTGRRYVFQAFHSPKHIPKPAMAPGWLLQMKPVPMAVMAKPKQERIPVSELDVAELVHDKVALARSWGLKVTGVQPDANRWIACRAIDREDVHPSCSFHVDTGIYYDHSTRLTLSFLGLAIALHAYQDYKTAADDLRKKF